MHFSTKTIASSVLASLLLVAGCSGDPENPSNTTSLADFNKKLIEAICTSAVDCHRAETKEECLATSQTELPEYQQYVDDGSVKFHPEKGETCLAAFETLGGCSITEAFSQGGFDQLESACVPVFEGTLAEGTKCLADEQCVSGNCDLVDPNCADACCEQKCMPKETPAVLPKIGEPCPDFDCESGAYCQQDMNGMPTTCAAQADIGQPCTSYSQCKLPGACDLDFATMMGTCKGRVAHGQACEPMSIVGCDRFDDYCDPMTKVCTTMPLPGAACVDGDCVDYAYCDEASMKCVKDLAEGAACTDMTDCQGELSCEMGKCAFDTPLVCP